MSIRPLFDRVLVKRVESASKSTGGLFLPESATDGSRNWDYRYSWVRDSAMAIRSMNLIGYPEEARGFFHFVRETIDRRHSSSPRTRASATTCRGAGRGGRNLAATYGIR